MKLSTAIVPVKKISSSVSRDNFAEDKLQQLAELILKVEGIINPPVLKRTSLESYQVVDGDFEYYAAAKAREIDPLKGEMISVFIIEPENEEFLALQIKVLRKRESDTQQLNAIPKQLESLPQQVENLTVKVARIAAESDTKKVNVALEQFESLTQQVENLTLMVTQVAESVKQIAGAVLKQPEPKPVTSMATSTKPKNYNSLTKLELTKLASQRNIRVTTKMNKPEIIAALKKADAAQ